MYVPYQCCQKSFEDYYTNQTGGALNYYQGAPYQNGYGFGGIFRSLFRAAAPLFRSAAPLFKSGAKAVGKQLFHTGVDVLKDVTRGDDIKLAAKRRFKEAGQHLTDKAAGKLKNMIGSGRNKRRKRMQNRITSSRAKKVKARDIFS